MLHTVDLSAQATPFRQLAEVAQNMQEFHAGQPRELLNADRHRVLLITLEPGAHLPEQYHLYANKTLMVLQGCAEIASDTETRPLHEGDTGRISFGTRHRISNIGKIPLRLLEIRTGACVEDDDSAT